MGVHDEYEDDDTGVGTSKLEAAIDGIFVQLEQIQQQCVEMGKVVNSNRVHTVIISRVLMTKLNEIIVATGIDVDLIDRETYADVLDEYKAIVRQDCSESMNAWLDGEEIPECMNPTVDDAPAAHAP